MGEKQQSIDIVFARGKGGEQGGGGGGWGGERVGGGEEVGVFKGKIFLVLDLHWSFQRMRLCLCFWESFWYR